MKQALMLEKGTFGPLIFKCVNFNEVSISMQRIKMHIMQAKKLQHLSINAFSSNLAAGISMSILV